MSSPDLFPTGDGIQWRNEEKSPDSVIEAHIAPKGELC